MSTHKVFLFFKEYFETEITPTRDFSWADGPCISGRRCGVKLERDITRIYYTLVGNKGVCNSHPGSRCLPAFLLQQTLHPTPLPKLLIPIPCLLASQLRGNTTKDQGQACDSMCASPWDAALRAEATRELCTANLLNQSHNHRPSGFLVFDTAIGLYKAF